MAGASEEDPVGVAEVGAVVNVADVAPGVASEILKTPAGSGEAQVVIPGDTGPVEFEALDLEFGGGLFEVIARAGVGSVTERIVHRVTSGILDFRFEISELFPATMTDVLELIS